MGKCGRCNTDKSEIKIPLDVCKECLKKHSEMFYKVMFDPEYKDIKNSILEFIERKL